MTFLKFILKLLPIPCTERTGFGYEQICAIPIFKKVDLHYIPMKERNRLFVPSVLGIIGGILGVLFGLEGLIFGFIVGVLLGFIVDQLHTYKRKAPEPRLLPPQPAGKSEDVGLITDFTDTRCNYCLSPQREVVYYCPQCKKPYCAKCYARSEINKKCPIDRRTLILIPENKKVSLRQTRTRVDNEGPLVKVQKHTTLQSTYEHEA